MNISILDNTFRASYLLFAGCWVVPFCWLLARLPARNSSVLAFRFTLLEWGVDLASSMHPFLDGGKFSIFRRSLQPCAVLLHQLLTTFGLRGIEDRPLTKSVFFRALRNFWSFRLEEVVGSVSTFVRSFHVPQRFFDRQTSALPHNVTCAQRQTSTTRCQNRKKVLGNKDQKRSSNIFAHQNPTSSVWIKSFSPLFRKDPKNIIMAHFLSNGAKSLVKKVRRHLDANSFRKAFLLSEPFSLKLLITL